MRYLLLTLIVVFAPAAWSDDDSDARERVAARFDSLSAQDVSPSPVEGLYQIFLGPQVYYVSADGEFLFHGDLFQLEDNVNLTEDARDLARLSAINAFGEQRMIVFRAPEERHVITVFTDVTCTYCRKLHREIDTYLDAGITVRYLPYPRSGPNTSSWREMERVWCSDDRAAALTASKLDQPVVGEICMDDVVFASYRLGQMIRFSGTPAIVTDSGSLIPGYLPVERLLPQLEGQSP
jgi:thiol:disulfide interchange protein DsbC